MKKFTLITFFFSIFLTFTVFAQKSYVNPTAKYAEMLGYRYEIATAAKGGEVGMVHLPDGRMVNAWDFYKGKVAQEFSYAAKLGFDVETETVKIDGYTIERAICVRSTKGVEERIPLLDLMKMNGDELIAEVKRTAPSIQDIATVDPDFITAKSLPTTFDWRDYNGHTYIGDARDQGSCGSCYSFGAAAAAEGTYNYATGNYDSNTADFSEAYIAFCLSQISPYSSHFDGCNGADYEYYELQALVDIGICDESYFPYVDATNQSCPSAATNAPKTKFESWNRVASSDVDAIKTAIMTYGVVDAAVYVTTSFSNYSGGVWSDNNNSCSNGAYTTTNHAIALVGWGYDSSEGDYWILRNSWGTSWGENGYMRIAVNSAAVDCAVCYMVYDNVPQPPVADFSTSTTTVVAGSSVSFSDLSTNTPSSWSWSFSGGTPSTSTSQNPTVTYNTIGTYNVSLTVANAEGNDSETKAGYISVVEQTYCESAGNSVSDEWIAGVQVGTFSNTSGAAKYSDFTSQTANLVAGQTYDITLTPEFSGSTYNEYWMIWIDLNGDADFDDANENVFDAGSLSKTTVTGALTIPSGTAAISTRMRVTMKYNGAPTACENTFSYGEVEDYTVNITTGTGNVDPVAVVNGPYNGTEDIAVSFSSSGTYDPDGSIASYLWNFGDGSTSTNANPSHTYSDAGTYDVTLTVTDDDGATDNDATTATIIAGGTGGDDVELAYSTFESGFGIWTDGGGDCRLYTRSTRAYEGSNAIDIQDNSGVSSSFYLTNGIDVHNPGFVQIDVEFYFYAYSMDNSNEDFWVQYYDGSSWNTVATYARSTDFDNNTFYVTTVTIDEAYYNFPTGMKIRFMCDASGNADDVYIDNVKITGKSSRTVTSPESNNVTTTKLYALAIEDDFVDEIESLKLYPNPAKEELNVVVPIENAKVKIINMSGTVVKEINFFEKENRINISDLPNGIYMIYVETEEGPMVERFIKQ
jgi:PKD repeat protein